MSVRPIFIGGCERSGTTLLGELLARHLGGVATPESQYLHSWLQGLAANQAPDPLRNRLVKNWRLKLWGLDAGTVQDIFDRWLNKPAKGMEELLVAFAEKHKRPVREHTLWIDHTPANLAQAPLLLEYFPDACFVHILRDGRAVYNSVKGLDWGPNTPVRAGTWWSKNIAIGLAAEQSLSTSRILRTRFENMVCEPDKIILKITEHFQLKPLSDGRSIELPAYTQQQHSLVKQAPSPARAAAWKQQLTSREVEWFEWEAGDLLRLLGYELTHGGVATGPHIGQRFLLESKELVRHRLNGVKFRLRKARGLRRATAQ